MFQYSMMPGATKNEPASVPAPVVFGAHAEAGRTSESGDGKATVTQRVVELLGLRVRPPVCLQLLGRLDPLAAPVRCEERCEDARQAE